MPIDLRNRVTAVWLFLVVATVVSWMLGTDHGVSSEKVAGVAVLAIAVVKVRLVGLYFMELRDAPTVLRSMMEVYSFGIGAMMVGLYLYA